MTDQGPGSKAAEKAAQYVEAIVAQAEMSADELAKEAVRRADEIRAGAEEAAGQELDKARRQAIALGQEARRAAQREIDEARDDAAKIREQTRREIEGRVAAAEEAAGQVLEEAKALSAGLRQLGSSLQSQGERILRDVQAAHKRMQADLRVSLPEEEPSRRRAEPTPRRATHDERDVLDRRPSCAAPRRAPEAATAPIRATTSTFPPGSSASR